MLLPRVVEELLVAVDEETYNNVVARIAESGIFHVDEPPEELGGWRDRSFQAAYMSSQEILRRLEGYFRLVDSPVSLVDGVELRIKSWLNALGDLERNYSKVLKEFRSSEEEITRLREKLEHLKSYLGILDLIKHVDADLRAAQDAESVSFAVGLAPATVVAEAEAATEDYDVLVATEVLGDDKQALIAVAGPHEDVARAVGALRRLGWSPLRIPEELPGNPREAYDSAVRGIDEIASRIEAIKEYLRKEYLGQLREYYTKVLILSRALKLLANTVRSGSLYFFRGYVDSRDKKRLESILDKATEGAYTLYTLGVGRRLERKPPTKVELPRILRPFKKILEMYGHPEPYELVPVVFMAVTMPVIFGLMFPDIGHGLLVVLFALLFMKKRDPEFAFVAALLGVAGMVTGFLAGEFFGPITGKPIVGIWQNLGYEEPPLASPVHAGSEMLYRLMSLSLWIAGFMLTFGAFLGLVDALLAGERGHAVAVKLPKLLIFGSASLPFLLYFDVHEAGSVIGEAVFGPRESLISNIVFYGFIAGLLGLLLGETILGYIEGHGLSHFGSGFMEMFESVLMTLGNIPSFLRILGLSLAHSGLMEGFTIMAEPFFEKGAVGLLIGAIVYIIGNILTAGLEAIIAFAHDLRLHFYEWFTKFYTGTGRPFTAIEIPIKAKIIIIH